MSFLAKIRPAKEAEVAALRARFADRPPRRPDDLPVRDFPAALRGGDRVIAEIKRRSPSHPAFRQPASPRTLARAYRRSGAAALSIVVDEAHFGTSLADVRPVKEAVDLPVLVKDFVIDEVQLLAAWEAGADCALLIVAMLDGPTLTRLVRFAADLGLHVLVECHDETEIEAAAAAGAGLIGVNNRDLVALTTDLAHGEALLPRVPSGAITVSESGLYRRADVVRMARAGADAFLIGHALLQSRDPGRKVAELAGRVAEDALRVKVCGLTSVADAVLAHEAGADLLGLIFVPSPRRVELATAREIRRALPDARLCGVVRDADPEELADLLGRVDLDLLQLHGDEGPDTCRRIAELTGRPLIKVLPADRATPELAARYDAVAAFLVDLPKDGDGSVTAADCRAAARALARAGHDVFLAGGLDPDNVAAAVRDARPFGVDVARGVEAAPGRKDPDRVRRFVAAARNLQELER
ncbi:hypothetical protein KDM41_09305 [bacterium]|nr:hypothetical protein [bacterium]